MPALQVRDFPEDLYAKLRNCAAQQDRSISQQTVHILREYLDSYKRYEPEVDNDRSFFSATRQKHNAMQRQDYAAKRREIFERIDSISKAKIPDAHEPSKLIRDAREERSKRSLAALGFDESSD